MTGRFTTRFELESAVRWAFFHTKATVPEIAIRMRVSQAVVHKITQKGPPVPNQPAETLIQPKITGYRQLSQAEADLMNEIKAKGTEIEALISKVSVVNALRLHAMKDNAGVVMVECRDVHAAFMHAQPERWAAIAKTDFQTALMALTRAVAQPSSF